MPSTGVAFHSRVGSLVRAIESSDEARIEEAVLRLSRSRRVFAPLAFAIGAFALLFDGLRLLVSNWRLTLVQVLPAMWIWVAMADLKAHVLHGHSFTVLRGPVLIPIVLAIVAITIACFFLNAVFAFAITRPGAPEIRPAVAQARRHVTPILHLGRRRRLAARAVDDGGHALGTPLVHALARHRHRVDDGQLRRRARAAHRRQADPLEARQADDDASSAARWA